MKSTLFYLTIGLLILSSCDSSSNDELQSFIPVSIGNEWVMLRTDSINAAQTRLDTFRVVSRTVISGEPWYTIENSNGEGLFPWSWKPSFNRYAFREAGVWRLKSDSEIQILQFPIIEGQAYSVGEGVTGLLVNENASLTLPQVGTVSAVEYAHTYSTDYKPFASVPRREFTELPLAEEVTLTSYFSPSLGPLRLVNMYVAPREDKVEVLGRITWELQEFIPAQ